MVAVAADITTGSKANLSWKRDPAVTSSPITHSELYWANPGGCRDCPGWCCWVQRRMVWHSKGTLVAWAVERRCPPMQDVAIINPSTILSLFLLTDVEKAAQCVRASVSMPAFFQPKVVPAEKGKKIPNAKTAANSLNNKWETVGFSTKIPDKVRLGARRACEIHRFPDPG